jgi:hypothetical protein
MKKTNRKILPRRLKDTRNRELASEIRTLATKREFWVGTVACFLVIVLTIGTFAYKSMRPVATHSAPLALGEKANKPSKIKKLASTTGPLQLKPTATPTPTPTPAPQVHTQTAAATQSQSPPSSPPSQPEPIASPEPTPSPEEPQLSPTPTPSPEDPLPSPTPTTVDEPEPTVSPAPEASGAPQQSEKMAAAELEQNL